jgi:hypothetical protein
MFQDTLDKFESSRRPRQSLEIGGKSIENSDKKLDNSEKA